MIRRRTGVSGRAAVSTACAFVSTVVALSASAPAAAQEGLEEIVVTAQRRETALQTTPVAISAYTGEALAENRVFTVNDLAASVPAFSLTAGTPLDVELNIRGVTNTRLDAPSADPSVGTFVDGIYQGRTGDLNYDFYDIERVEVIRGPQGVLLGKNVVGGALSVIRARPTFENSGAFQFAYGNYNSVLAGGHVNGGLTDSIAGRASFQYRSNDGFARDILHDREVENLDSIQARVQLLYAPDGSAWKTRLALEYNNDSTNGINVVAVDGGIANCETTYLRSNCTRPWSQLRRFLGITNPRQNVAQSIQYAGQPRIQQFMERDGVSAMLDVEFAGSGFSFNSLTGYRSGNADQVYDQTGGGPEALNWDTARWLEYRNFVAATIPPGNGSNGLFLFAQPVGEKSDVRTFTQEFRLTSDTPDSRFDWIAGLFYMRDEVDKIDRFIGENFLGSINPTGTNPLSTLSGENRWVNNGENTSYAVFGQIGFKFTDALKLSVGVRYTSDDKTGNVTGTVIATGDRFAPTDPRANVTIESLCRTPAGGIVTPTPATCVAPNRWTYQAGDSFSTAYGRKWSETTPQATLDWTVSDKLFTYATVARGFKGGGFDDTPANIPQATTPYNPETVTNYEIGFKANLLDRRIRLNADVFFMDYKNLQVTQTNAACLCNLTDNAASADIKGVEAEFLFAVTNSLRLSLSGSYVDATYKDFLESAIIPGSNPPQRLDSSGNRLQRTPETQVSAGVDYTTGTGRFADALRFSVNYYWQSDLFWATDNIAREKSYGLLNARIALAPNDANWTVALWGRNVTDELFRTNIIPFFGEEVSQFGPPRTYGLELSWKF